jgi:transposase
MMGIQGTPARLSYDFCLEEHVPVDHVLRGINRHLALDDLRQSLKPFYSRMGRPSVDPELMIRMLIVGYCMGIRSERRLCEETHLNLAYRWFCRLGLDGRVPDHSTFSKNRHGCFRESDALRRLFESLMQRCLAEGLVSADGFAVDASLIAADANKQRSVPSREWKSEEIKETATRATQEYLATLDNVAFGAASPVTPKFISRSDPAAQWTGAHKGHAFFAYANNYLIDTDHGVIVDVEATRAIRQAEVGAARTMNRDALRHKARVLGRRQRLRLGGEPGLAGQTQGDRATHSGLRQIKSNRWHVLSRRFSLRRRTRPLHLPRGQRACSIPTHIRHSQKRRHSRGHKTLSRQQIGLRCLQAQSPVLSERSCPQDPAGSRRRCSRRGRALAATPQYVEACRRRKKIEMLFAHLKRILRLTRLRLRGPNGARDEFLLAATAQNLRRLARLRPTIELPDAMAA